jgi:hypothetical protein
LYSPRSASYRAVTWTAAAFYLQSLFGVALLLDLAVVKTHSRPHVSDDNPYSESQFRTLKYRPGFPDPVVFANPPSSCTTLSNTTLVLA